MEVKVFQDRPLPGISGRGRPVGDGDNIRFLKALKPGDTVWDVPAKRMATLRASAARCGIKVMARKIPGGSLYAFKILPEENNQ